MVYYEEGTASGLGRLSAELGLHDAIESTVVAAVVCEADELLLDGLGEVGVGDDTGCGCLGGKLGVEVTAGEDEVSQGELIVRSQGNTHETSMLSVFTTM